MFIFTISVKKWEKKSPLYHKTGHLTMSVCMQLYIHLFSSLAFSLFAFTAAFWIQGQFWTARFVLFNTMNRTLLQKNATN